ncbi:MAG: 50S ribosomal protein L18 [Candidatus Moranbacteria bacterium RIFOXYA12_FULL_35_19]|nr:MAG: 50S ribosomal protein L18 [Candidatus Moranbacteria bacterium GW2011_GWF2_35_39]OGI31651.1 MAG: 50S ribosomal protein L18 [Candidatus Moranbacteria bacterium RIFOXYB12_FULL_35_8]OGI32821.1 MAG: 50S ribosomal protein L18 [Candidatus Moranbacteria bacterium RIFOXYC12_FULL_36_13]OGI36149.1 MAG: 50S ribosomal protein L18 [Candidatus Moranbacteria bacterium RIFOXYA12_FULL_35_19]
MKTSRNNLRLHRKKRIRAKVKGDSKTPRLAIFRSLKGISVQVIDDTKGATLVFGSLKEIKNAGNNLEGAKKLGILIAKKCVEKKISAVVYDRSGYKYHGKVKALAEGAREGGLKF